MRDSSAFSVCIFFEESVFIFQFLNAQLCQTNHNCEFHHPKIEKKNAFSSKSIQTEKAEESLGMRTYALFDIIVQFIIQKLINKHTFLK